MYQFCIYDCVYCNSKGYCQQHFSSSICHHQQIGKYMHYALLSRQIAKNKQQSSIPAAAALAVHGMENVVVVDLTGLSLVPGNAVFQAAGFGLQFQRRTTATTAAAVKLEPAMLYTVSSLTIFSNVCREKYNQTIKCIYNSWTLRIQWAFHIYEDYQTSHTSNTSQFKIQLNSQRSAVSVRSI